MDIARGPATTFVDDTRIRPMVVSDVERLVEIDSNFESPIYLDVVKEIDGLNVTWRLIQRPFDVPFARTNFEFDATERKDIRQRFETADGLWLVAESAAARRLVGVVDVKRENWREAGFVWNIAVDRACRGQGIGYGLMKRVIEWGQCEGLRAIILETQTNNWPACRFYQRFGFQISGIDDHYYTNRDVEKKDVALFWTYELRGE
jgi:ribosomal protein S18 acetylase RimI-like enzyme